MCFVTREAGESAKREGEKGYQLASAFSTFLRYTAEGGGALNMESTGAAEERPGGRNKDSVTRGELSKYKPGAPNIHTETRHERQHPRTV
jgi:hypothetical protein